MTDREALSVAFRARSAARVYYGKDKDPEVTAQDALETAKRLEVVLDAYFLRLGRPALFDPDDSAPTPRSRFDEAGRHICGKCGDVNGVRAGRCRTCGYDR